MEPERALLRHMLATIAYRGGKTIRDAPPGFASFQADGCLNTPALLLAHIGDLMEWAHRWCCGEERSFQSSEPLTWNEEVNRFYAVLASFDQWLASGESLQPSVEALFQAPIADALTHIGQLSLLRRMSGDPLPGEAFRSAHIVAGRVGPHQDKPEIEFDPDKGAIWRKP
jgi:hypothetical protein